MKKRPSTAPIALLLATGLICLALSAMLPTNTESYTPAGQDEAGHATAAVTVTSTDWPLLWIAIGLLTLAVASFAGAGWQVYRRRRWNAQR